MKKKQRCLLKRFAALIAALMLCASLCVPAFASNNASTQKWVVSDERQLKNESGTYSRYLLLSPYVDGAKYAAVFQTLGSSVSSTGQAGSYDFWLSPVNYPDWWRSAIPLGAVAYFHISSLNIVNFKDSKGTSSPSSVYFLPLNSAYALTSTASYGSSAASLSQPYPFYPYVIFRSASGYGAYKYTASGVGISVSGSGTAYYPFQDCLQLIYSPFLADFPSYGSINGVPYGFGYSTSAVFANLSSNELVFAVSPKYPNDIDTSSPYTFDLTVSAVVEFWVDANKLPGGLQVGDEFPANTDAFDQMRDTLIEQFPEASEHIKNDNSTLTGWNDTETVDTDVASSAMSALNAMFQNLGSFLFIVSLMVFGAVVLRMFIRKAVDG